MPQMLILPAIIMSLAFVLYTAGVWSERLQRDLKDGTSSFSGSASHVTVQQHT